MAERVQESDLPIKVVFVRLDLRDVTQSVELGEELVAGSDVARFAQEPS